ncbi:MAG: hypothetical protein RBR45_15440 [Pseudomonas sp.]|jgi:hypothetical protein|nr:hypothetical protein [Pseudomonas sp.]
MGKTVRPLLPLLFNWLLKSPLWAFFNDVSRRSHAQRLAHKVDQ